MKAGPLRHRLKIQSPDEVQDSYGQEIPSDFTTEATRWAEVRPLRGQEALQAATIQDNVTHKIVMRYFEGLTPKHRLQLGSRTFEILEVLNVHERNSMMEILAKEDV